MHEQLKNEKDNTYKYKRIVEALKYGTKNKGAIIEVLTDEVGLETYQPNVKSKQYKLTDTYFKAGLEVYFLKDESIINQRNKFFYRSIIETSNNTISRNLFHVYQSITIPKVDEIIAHGRLLIKDKFKTKKQKKLTMRNKHPNSYWKDYKHRSFVEDNIELFKFLTSRGFMIPIVGDDDSGGRVVDSFNLMPSWIRSLVKINGEPIVECDFTAMHPNLASFVYGGTGRHISHKEVADYLSIDVNIAKIEHLSFFNKPYLPSKGKAFKGSTKPSPRFRSSKRKKFKGSMVQSPVFRYYQENEPTMLENIRLDKNQNGYKSTAHKLFKLEVELMTEIIKKLNDLGVYVLYVYDALYCAQSDVGIVTSTMNEVMRLKGIKTYVK